MRRAALILLTAATCLWSYSLGWQRGEIASNLAFNRRLADVTRVLFEKTASMNEAGDDDAQVNADD